MAKKILLAEDSVTMQKVVEMTFAAEDFNITAVSTGAEAIAKVVEIKPDLVIADLSLDGKNGYDVCQIIKGTPALAQIPVLLLHGNAAPLDESKAAAVKADGHISKPFESQQLINKAKALTKGAPAKAVTRKAVVSPQVEPITIDTAGLGTMKPAKDTKPIKARPRRTTQPPPLPPRARRHTGPPPPPPRRRPSFVSAPEPDPARFPLTAKIITIEAELPPDTPEEPLPSFDTIQYEQPGAAPKPAIKERPAAAVTSPGFPKPDLPPPPKGLPLPPEDLEPSQPAIAVTPQVDSKMLREAVDRVAREVIEKIAWEVVPDLAEKIIRDELGRLVEKPRSK